MKPKQHYSQNRRDSLLTNLQKGLNYIMGVRFEDEDVLESKIESIKEGYPAKCDNLDCLYYGIIRMCYEDGFRLCSRYKKFDERGFYE